MGWQDVFPLVSEWAVRPLGPDLPLPMRSGAPCCGACRRQANAFGSWLLLSSPRTLLRVLLDALGLSQDHIAPHRATHGH